MKREKENYISLQEATKYCNYSQEYLSLRARQGKLEAIKLDRNWMTKREWVEKYMAKTEEYNNSLEALKAKNFKKVKKEIWPPANLPIGEFDEREFAEIMPLQIKEPVIGVCPVEKIRKTTLLLKLRSIRISSTGFRFAFATVLVFVLLIAGGVLVFPNFVKQNLKGLTINYNLPLTYILEETGEVIVEEVRYATSQVTKGSFFTVINSQGIFKEYICWLSDTIKTGTLTFVEEIRYIADAFRQTGRYISQSFKKAYWFVTRPWRISLSQEERITEEQIVPELGEKEGMVVILSTEDDEETKEKIKTAFSDEVRVEPEDDSSGIIIPIFRDREGEEYLYVLVPVKDN